MTLRLREDYDAGLLRALAREVTRAEVRQRLLGIAAIYDGASRADAAEIAGVGRQILRDWVIRFNADGPVGLHDSEAKGGRTETLTREQKAILHEILTSCRPGNERLRLSYKEILAVFGAKTGRTLSFRCLSDHIASLAEAGSGRNMAAERFYETSSERRR